MTPLRERMIEDMKLRNFSPRKIEAYVMRASGFARHFGRSAAALGREEVTVDSLGPEQDLVFECRLKVRSSARRTAAGATHQLIMTADGVSFR